jgi:hypothetical protein
MKSKTLRLLVVISVLIIASHSVMAQINKTYTGNWSFTAPSAPDEYMSGVIELKKDSAIITFTDMSYRFPSNWVKVKNDSLLFETTINNDAVLFSLKLDKKNITGNAIWSEGETQMILTKKESKD